MSHELDYECSGCEHEFTIRFTPATRNRYMNGRMEDAEQGSAAEAYPRECPECGSEVDTEWLQDNHAD